MSYFLWSNNYGGDDKLEIEKGRKTDFDHKRSESVVDLWNIQISLKKQKKFIENIH